MKSAPPYLESVAAFPLPFDLWPFQQGTVNDLAPRPRSGLYAEVGTGKTGMSTVMANYQRMIGMADCHIVTCPPIIITAWVRWLQKIPGLRVLAYRGDPRERAALTLTGHDFIVMSLPIFKKDYRRIEADLAHLTVGMITDEATSIKNIESDNFRFTRDFVTGRPLILLTGTPLATPEDAYAYVKLLAPDVYRNKRMFDNLHVAKRDFFGNVKKWDNLDVLHENMKINSVRLLKAEHLPQLLKPIYTPIPYELDPEHMALYKLMAEEQLIELENGGKIDATSVSKLFTCMQQIILNWGHFAGDPDKKPAGFDLLDHVLDEINAADKARGKKLVIFANYRMTMKALTAHLQPYGVRLVNSEVTPRQREQAIDAFINDPQCRTIAINPQSGGLGVDGLQDVSSDVLFLECPTSPIYFEQAVGRIYRTGQRHQPNVRIAVAEKTLQVRLHQMLLKNNELTNYVQGGFESLREALYGGN
jgi:SWI/SNF-related matrix-associated actin-dependent regulator 1 of chromatin subfamily A